MAAARSRLKRVVPERARSPRGGQDQSSSDYASSELSSDSDSGSEDDSESYRETESTESDSSQDDRSSSESDEHIQKPSKTEVVKSRTPNTGGTSCHQCKVNQERIGELETLMRCTNLVPTRTGKLRRCRKKYCAKCLEHHYPHYTKNKARFACPACNRECGCRFCCVRSGLKLSVREEREALSDCASKHRKQGAQPTVIASPAKSKKRKRGALTNPKTSKIRKKSDPPRDGVCCAPPPLGVANTRLRRKLSSPPAKSKSVAASSSDHSDSESSHHSTSSSGSGTSEDSSDLSQRSRSKASLPRSPSPQPSPVTEPRSTSSVLATRRSVRMRTPSRTPSISPPSLPRKRLAPRRASSVGSKLSSASASATASPSPSPSASPSPSISPAFLSVAKPGLSLSARPRGRPPASSRLSAAAPAIRPPSARRVSALQPGPSLSSTSASAFTTPPRRITRPAVSAAAAKPRATQSRSVAALEYDPRQDVDAVLSELANRASASTSHQHPWSLSAAPRISAPSSSSSSSSSSSFRSSSSSSSNTLLPAPRTPLADWPVNIPISAAFISAPSPLPHSPLARDSSVNMSIISSSSSSSSVPETPLLSSSFSTPHASDTTSRRGSWLASSVDLSSRLMQSSAAAPDDNISQAEQDWLPITPPSFLFGTPARAHELFGAPPLSSFSGFSHSSTSAAAAAPVPFSLDASHGLTDTSSTHGLHLYSPPRGGDPDDASASAAAASASAGGDARLSQESSEDWPPAG